MPEFLKIASLSDAEVDRLEADIREAIIDLDNPYISAAHLEAAAYEQPLTDTDRDYFGEAALIRAEGLVQAGRLRRQPAGLAWTRPHSPAAQTSLRSASMPLNGSFRSTPAAASPARTRP